MPSTPPISDLSRLYGRATMDETTPSFLGASLLPSTTTNYNLGSLHLMNMRRGLLSDDPRTASTSALLLQGGGGGGIPSLPPSTTTTYEDEMLARRHQAQSDVLRRYHELKVLEAASAAAAAAGHGVNSLNPLTRASDLIAAATTNLPPRRLSQMETAAALGAAAARRLSPSSMLSMGQQHATELSSTSMGGRRDCCFAQRYQEEGFGRTSSSAFERIERSSDGRFPPPFSSSSVEIAMGVKKHQQGGETRAPVTATSKLSSSTTATAAVAEPEDEEAFFQTSSSGGSSNNNKERFPVKLYRMLWEMEKEGRTDIVTFLPHGKAFAILKEEVFVQEILPRYFANCQLSSLQKQLNLYGFHKITVGKDKGKLHYFHSSFLKGKPSLTEKIQRRRTRGGGGAATAAAAAANKRRLSSSSS